MLDLKTDRVVSPVVMTYPYSTKVTPSYYQ